MSQAKQRKFNLLSSSPLFGIHGNIRSIISLPWGSFISLQTPITWRRAHPNLLSIFLATGSCKVSAQEPNTHWRMSNKAEMIRAKCEFELPNAPSYFIIIVSWTFWRYCTKSVFFFELPNFHHFYRHGQFFWEAKYCSIFSLFDLFPRTLKRPPCISMAEGRKEYVWYPAEDKEEWRLCQLLSRTDGQHGSLERLEGKFMMATPLMSFARGHVIVWCH